MAHGDTEHSHIHRDGAEPGDACAHAQDHAARRPQALAEAEQACADKGLRLTPIRRQVLDALYATHRPMSAYDLIEALAPGGGERRLAPITVYRALDFLIDNGFVHKLESRNAFIACPFHHAPDDLVVFMICEHCGGVDEACSDELRGALAHLAAAQGFRPHANVIELAGRCAHCAGPEREHGPVLRPQPRLTGSPSHGASPA